MPNKKSPSKTSAITKEVETNQGNLVKTENQSPNYANILEWLMNFLLYEVPPGPKIIPVNIIINLQKCGISVWTIFLMFYFNNFSTAMWFYLLLHGSYGAFWVLKDVIFPDPNFQKKATVMSGGLVIWLTVLGHYMVPVYQLASRNANNDISIERMWVCTLIYIVGLVLMLLSDSQKFYTLKYKKGLISDGMFKYTRNPNYLGEIMIYGAFILLVNDTLAYICVIQVWVIVFSIRMYIKEVSLRKKEGWQEYSARSWVLIPKINGRTVDSLIFYGAFAYLTYSIYLNGGLTETAQLVQNKIKAK
eukprot:403362503